MCQSCLKVCIVIKQTTQELKLMSAVQSGMRLPWKQCDATSDDQRQPENKAKTEPNANKHIQKHLINTFTY